jgi:hypothetical protein
MTNAATLLSKPPAKESKPPYCLGKGNRNNHHSLALQDRQVASTWPKAFATGTVLTP